MVGICVAVGDEAGVVDRLRPELTPFGTEETATTVEGLVGATTAVHDERSGGYAENDGVAVWAWGDVAGFDGPEGYRRRPADGRSLAAYCAALYAEYGPRFVRWLNGRFALAVRDDDRSTVTVATDRLGSRPVYRWRANGTLLFATSVQAFARHPDRTPAFDRDGVRTYLAHRRTFGTQTVFDGVARVPPASLVTVDLDSLATHTDRYWYPRYRPVERPASHFVDELATLFRRSVAERTDPDRDHGVMLSGGSDSRFILGATDRPLRAYHLTDWLNRETRVAARVCETADCRFDPLLHDESYYPETLDANARLSNFVGTFHEGHATGFADRLRSEVDALLVGHLSDVFFGAHYLPRRTVSVGPLSTSVPTPDPLPSLAAYRDSLARPTPPYLGGPATTAPLLDRQLASTGDGSVALGGVEYRSLADLVRFGPYFPLSNVRTFFEDSLDQLLPVRNPFFDTRLIDLHLRIPQRYLLRRNLVGRAVARLDPDLAAVPHAGTSVRLSAPFPVQYAGRLATSLGDRRASTHETAPYLSNGPWTNHAALIRSTDFVREALAADADLVRALPFLDADGVNDCYLAHRRGADRTDDLYALLTLLRAPATRRTVDAPLAVERTH